MSDKLQDAPSAVELLANPIVQAALDEAWDDSQTDEPDRRHEERGWIYVELTTGEITTRRAGSGGQAAIDLSSPPIIDGHMIVGKFHTPQSVGGRLGSRSKPFRPHHRRATRGS